jgi:CRP/FNR family cyclic AMP-dependent transcriptional regulator
MAGRYFGAEAARHLLDAIHAQQLVRGDARAHLAERVAAIAAPQVFAAGEWLTQQGDDEHDLYLILSGRVAVKINGNEMAQRPAGTHVGEMSLIDPAAKRSASCLALDEVVAARIAEPAFSALAREFPVLWRNVALVLGDRLRERTKFVRTRNETPILFIGSSRESLPIAYGLQAGLVAASVIVRVWPHGVFKPSNFPIEDLEEQLERADFALLVFGPDDRVLSRRVFSRAPRDNVILETGLFMGALRRQRTLILKSRGLSIKMPSDLLGLTPIEFDPGSPSTLASRLQPACKAIAECVQRHGAR